ncbi:hypothetical protein [Luteibacter yeojuensis]|uniref:Uncharacterized protein n=1 Tax=Luteibacter yeojuensis TaxID=345309 RepID=A0A7X5QS72_9GAMM|nr:hypothetical protein [Luteibacter yeojuensis]NID14394.1 hypothetical protein [Luteibacter yeojuensis]
MSDAFAKWKNENGTYNGAAMFAELTGIPQEEIVWSANRMKELKAQGVPRDQWSRIVGEEAKLKPWASP